MKNGGSKDSDSSTGDIFFDTVQQQRPQRTVKFQPEVEVVSNAKAPIETGQNTETEQTQPDNTQSWWSSYLPSTAVTLSIAASVALAAGTAYYLSQTAPADTNLDSTINYASTSNNTLLSHCNDFSTSAQSYWNASGISEMASTAATNISAWVSGTGAAMSRSASTAWETGAISKTAMSTAKNVAWGTGKAVETGWNLLGSLAPNNEWEAIRGL